jgi:hypothetical protein
LDDPTNTDGYIKVGRLFLGEYLQMDPSSLIEFPETRARTDNVTYSIGNQMYGDKGVEYISYNYAFPQSGTTARTNINSMWGTVGRWKPFFFTNFDTTYTVIEPIYCHLTNDLSYNHVGGSQWSGYQLNIREVD